MSKLNKHAILMDVRIRILIVTTFDDEYIFQSLQVGALGYLLKRTLSQEIAAAIRSVSQIYCQLGPMIALTQCLSKLT